MLRARVFLFSLLLSFPAAAFAQSDQASGLRTEVKRLQGEVEVLQAGVKARDDVLEATARELRAVGGEVAALRAALPSPLAGSFLAAPPLPSDIVGVAKVAVFAPRLEVESARRHDIVFLRLRRIEADAVKPVAELELPQDGGGVELPIDRSGAVYVVDWSTSDGNPYALQLKDGASSQLAASVQIRPQQAQGRFLFVGFRLE
jgi:hypothetical protein